MDFLMSDLEEAVLALSSLDRMLRSVGKGEFVGQGTILDLCCGTGNNAREFKKRYPSCMIIGMDYNGLYLRDAAVVPCLRGDANALPFANESLDVVFTCKVYDYTYPKAFPQIASLFPHSIDADVMFGEIHRVLKPRGLYIPWADFEFEKHPFLQEHYEKVALGVYEKK